MRLRGGYVRRLFAGAVFGLYTAHLLYFLNPQITISPLHLAGVAIVYALIAAVIFGNALWLLHLLRARLLTAEREGGAREHGFGFVALATLLSAVVFWGHVLLLRVYLPREAVRNLSKASTIVAAAALILFVLWLIERTAPRKLSLSLFGAGCAVIVLSSLLLLARRERYRAEAAPAGSPVSEARQPGRVMVVAIPSLPFDWIIQLVGEDLLPFFARAREESFLTRLEPFPTTSPKSLWASLATGKLPHAHGVTGRFSYRTPLNPGGHAFLLVPSWIGFKAWGLIPPVQRISAQLPAGDSLPLWKLMDRFGSRAAVVNWPGVTRQYLNDEASAEVLRDQSSNQQIKLLMAALGDLETLKPGGNSLPARTTRKGQEIRSAVEQVDRLFTRLEAALPGATIIVVSPSGPRPPALPATPLQLALNWMAQDELGSSDGFLLIRGPIAARRDSAAPAAITDIVPTALFAAGLPVARDMDGRAVAEAFSEEFVQQNPISLIPTFETRRHGDAETRR